MNGIDRKKSKYGIGIIIAVLPVLGLAAILLMKLVGMYVDSKADHAFLMGEYGSEIAWQLTEQRLLENSYLNNPQNEILNTISEQAKKMNSLFQEANALEVSQDIHALIERNASQLASHQLIFDKAGELVRQLAENRLKLQSYFNKSDQYLKTAINNIIDEETRLTIIQGLNLPDKKIALRNGFQEVLNFNASAMLNINELLTFGDQEVFETNRTRLRKNMNISLNNTSGVVISVNESRYSELWEKIVNEYKDVISIQDEVYEQWKILKDLGRELDKSNAELKLTIQSTVNGVKQYLKQIQQTGTRITATTIIIAIIMLAVFSLLIIRYITNLLKEVVIGLNQGALQITDSSSKVLNTSQQLSEGALDQSAAIEQTSSILEQISSMTKQNADNANHADRLMKEADAVIKDADAAMKELTVSMEKISAASENTSKIVKTIDEIAFQTNLLALNAAVEAARAGESGAGFAVVADEVRNLAMRAAGAARNTSELIEETVALIKSGSEHVFTSGQGFVKTIESTSRVGNLLAEIAGASREQADGIEQVNRSVSNMDKLVQQLAEHSRESRSESGELNTQAEKMKKMVDNMVALVGGNLKISS
ncbi:Methyl-accepting chemotaxis protein signailing domain-containing protein [Desulfonema limicola]|uniref:Methyl-accepting chemotaxis protein signailing domain-containing protein n=1 Tax=Desulfonema limicola TaxID=45656 RepID=A0A975GG48_9BACT|nr:methyl-accepting chemotaxis protein [Desulfonema limicola]QTA79917.1 Methyl-accepting chemotaxis protein signailing domain-containing protein [Desulfonema limicola]